MQTRRSGHPVTQVLVTLDLISGQRQLDSCMAKFAGVPGEQLTKLSSDESARSLDLAGLCQRIVSKFPALSKLLLYLGVKQRKQRLVNGLLDAGQSAAEHFSGTLLMELLHNHHPVIFLPSRHPTLQEDVQLARRLVAAGCPPLLCPDHAHNVLSAALTKGHLPLVTLLLLEFKVQLPPGHAPPNCPSYYHLLMRQCIARPYSADYPELARALRAAGASVPTTEGDSSLLGEVARRAAVHDGLESEAPLDLLDCFLDMELTVYAPHALPPHHLLCMSVEHQSVDRHNFRRLLRTMSRAGANINTLYGEVPPEYGHCLHVFVQSAMSGELVHAPALLRIMVEEGADVASAAVRYPSPLDVLVSRGGLLLDDHHQFEAPSYAPELARILIEEGCKVESPLLTPSGELAAPATLHYFAFLLQRHLFCEVGVSPTPLTANEMELCGVLLEAAGRERSAAGATATAVGRRSPAPEDDTSGSLLDAAILLGNLDLVRLLLRTLPEAVAASEAKRRVSRVQRQGQDPRWDMVKAARQRGLDSVLSMATEWLRRRLSTIEAQWPSATQAAPGVDEAVTKAHGLMDLLLGAGATPMMNELEVAVAAREARGVRGRKRPRRRCVAAQSPAEPLPHCLLVMPAWAQEVLSFLPAQLSAVRWSPATAAAFPPALRAAVRTLLLINSCRGFGVDSSKACSWGGTAGAAQQQERQGQRQQQQHPNPTQTLQQPRRSPRGSTAGEAAPADQSGGQRPGRGKAAGARAAAAGGVSAQRGVLTRGKRKRGGGAPEGSAHSRKGGEGAAKREGGVELPLDVLCKILAMASCPLLRWVPLGQQGERLKGGGAEGGGGK